VLLLDVVPAVGIGVDEVGRDREVPIAVALPQIMRFIVPDLKNLSDGGGSLSGGFRCRLTLRR
jgi:hypothetical protein